MLIDPDSSKPAPDTVRTYPTADDIRTVVEDLGYDLKLREFAPRTEIGIRNFEERCKAVAAALSPPNAAAAEPITWQKRLTKLADGSWTEWKECSIRDIEWLKKAVEPHLFETRALYAAPPVRGDRPTRQEFYKLLDKHTSLPERTNQYLCRIAADQYGWFAALHVQPGAADRSTFYSILSTYIPSESIDSAWQELRESGLVP